MAQGLTLVADSSAWVAYYRSSDTPAKFALDQAILNHSVLVPDLVLVEVLRGLGSEKIVAAISREFRRYKTVETVGTTNAVLAAKYYRHLRRKGITVRGTIDLLIATWCIENGVPLLHSDRDYEGFHEYLGMKRWPISG